MSQLREDGDSNQKRVGAGVVVITAYGNLLEQAITPGFPISNNEAELEALLAGLYLPKELSTIYLDSQLCSILVEHLHQPSIKDVKQPNLIQIDEDPSWQDPIIDYLMNENLPNDKSEARKIIHKAARYYMKDSILVRRSYSDPHLTCIKYLQILEITGFELFRWRFEQNIPDLLHVINLLDVHANEALDPLLRKTCLW
ncbi:hypothetical protein L3X38_010907 [Prunus dulcis]|uniref:RNase H type-1 domain-containing protein n=1 Tax=Prunus dulcis TaxID=3755 RepID=A0AAD4WH39_PRUDU|nr:hypothetical protein L3X38_010907 [Prunus dulcis]